ncbi:MAG: 16S rRNA (guanine(966)-N(2))-methyltransferase RsmD [Agathobaculum sp.]|jgi:16S rRNA (guanine966-N2)-methyltransferase|uniref:16S rRNA (guanine(966)-N(2))-methyltransferase RsmD n=1 Tax=Agathobaculum sp. TaxID=2048138 RepID=UPI003D94ECB6
MRVVSGSARGCRLQPVPGMNTRPTTDRVKENIFNLIQEHVRGARVLDLFAGTGQLGIEALSRGAQHCDFVESGRAAYDIVCKNVQAARVQERASLHKKDAGDFLSHVSAGQFDLIFLDPPYGGKILENALMQIERFDILSANGIIICESAIEDRFAHAFETVRERRYGATLITVLRRRDGGTDGQYEDSDLPGQF